ncbi:hypothetical protein TASIC1_0007048900 [Trichoderma asperellum]|uniref:Uncharacterized protein n=1 Tax=Trichoderma asperellum TaxID=101201 RepID=A0A6V8QWJ9_TRIAP|nr:hypothetical protein TASIC1_0007048900 [Trichoderma asperellum]
MSDADENDLFNIQVSDSEDDKVEKKSRRTGQTEDEFQAVKNTYRAKVENGNNLVPTNSMYKKFFMQRRNSISSAATKTSLTSYHESWPRKATRVA